MKILWMIGLAILVSPAVTQKMDVKVIAHQDSETSYTYSVPGYSTSTSQGDINCNQAGTTTNCSATTTTDGVTTAPRSLLIPDGRVAVVNCASKYKPAVIPLENLHSRRSCRIPLVNVVTAEFSGKNAKISWPVSLDGKKVESETYTIVAILPKR